MLQRHRYIDAYRTDREIQTVEEDFISKNYIDEAVLCRMRSSAGWRAGLVVSIFTPNNLDNA